MFFAPIPEKGISDFIAHGSIIQVLTVARFRLACLGVLALKASRLQSSDLNGAQHGFY